MGETICLGGRIVQTNNNNMGECWFGQISHAAILPVYKRMLETFASNKIK